MTISQRTTQRVWAAISIVLACLTVAACPEDHGGAGEPKVGRIWTPAAPSAAPTVVIRGTVQESSGEPIAGAQVVVTAGWVATAVSDIDGRFDLGSLDVASRQVRFDVRKSGYLPQVAGATISSAVIDIPLKMRRLNALPIAGSITADLLPTDPPDYVGEAYESDYSPNTRYYTFNTQNAEVMVDLEWDHAAAPRLKMWALNGSLVSDASGTHEVLRLPFGEIGILLVGVPYPGVRLAAPVRFTLTVR